MNTFVKKMRTPFALMFVVVLMAGLVGCTSPTAAPTLPTTAPTVDLQPTLNAVQTQAVQTAVANITRNAPTALPPTPITPPTQTSAVTATLAATNTPLPPTAAPTATFVPWTLTPTTAPYSCAVLESSPKATDTFAVSTNFDAKWVIKNNGLNKWLKEETDVRYSTGTKMQKKGDIQDLTTNVANGESYTVTMDMVTPADVGTYQFTWVVITGKITICQLNLTIVVK